jgi:hypothetical protein
MVCVGRSDIARRDPLTGNLAVPEPPEPPAEALRPLRVQTCDIASASVKPEPVRVAMRVQNAPAAGYWRLFASHSPGSF